MAKWAPIAYTRTFSQDFGLLAHPSDHDINFWNNKQFSEAANSNEGGADYKFITIRHNGYRLTQV